VLPKHGAVGLHSAAGDVRTVISLLPTLLKSRPQLEWREPVLALEKVPDVGCPTRLRTVSIQRGDTGWMSDLMSKLPDLGQTDGSSARYAELLSLAMADGKIVAEEARELAHAAADSGLGASRVREIHGDFLEGMRIAAMADEVITADELKQLRGAAKALGIPTFFDDLTVSGQVGASTVRTAAPRERTSRVLRCGICASPGHNRRSCPQITGVDP
jgi:hypothetical protein